MCLAELIKSKEKILKNETAIQNWYNKICTKLSKMRMSYRFKFEITSIKRNKLKKNR